MAEEPAAEVVEIPEIEEEETRENLKSEFPLGRIKKIMKIDPEINKINSEALHLVSLSTDLFLQFLTEKSAEAVLEKKRKTIKLEHLRIAAKRHQPTADFLLDSLPMPSSTESNRSGAAAATQKKRSESAVEKPLPVGTRRIDDFFKKSAIQES
ncbi:hypothetical protein MKW94_014736 [Papaver nudicaule]|uniref:Transcription factor CBF/NF-Y/archaeal histone domain-containing protein n=1 Tax=Papaver nudicaule TaxID=74823 RepID=A0AA41RPE6_PAPNU|nr:hypothetical protein [Papaver nudicaule]MCL7039358.1 hypothetical protein [Papaver nudicaule]